MEKKFKKPSIRLQCTHGVQHCIALLRGVCSALYGEMPVFLPVNIGKVYFMGVFVP